MKRLKVEEKDVVSEREIKREGKFVAKRKRWDFYPPNEILETERDLFERVDLKT